MISTNNPIVALFSAINESTWEHLKLLFFPMLLTSIIGYIFISKSFNSYWCSRAIGILVSLAFTVVFFYTYSGILGKNIAIIDIISFFISVILGEFENKTVNYNSPEIFRQIRDSRHLFFFGDISTLKIFDLPLSMIREFKKPVSVGDCYYIDDNVCYKIKTPLSKGSE